MAELRVEVRWRDELVVDRVLPVRGTVRLGDDPDAAVAFPGTTVSVRREGPNLLLHGRRLARGQRTGFRVGEVRVTVEHVRPRRRPAAFGRRFDLRFLLATLAVLAATSWTQAIERWAARPPSPTLAALAQTLRDRLGPAWVEPAMRQDERAAAVQFATAARPLPEAGPRPGEGPPAEPDDERTGWDWYGWYRAAVPTDLGVLQARARVAGDPANADDADLAVVAWGALRAELYEEALEAFRRLLQRHPDDPDALAGMAVTLRRVGHHAEELDTYVRLLAQRPDDLPALAARAVAMARVGRLGAAHEALDDLRARAAGDPLVTHHAAMIAALEGREDDAVDLVERIMRRWDALDPALRLAIRRDLAIDPAFARLRTAPRLLAVMHRHLGAAAPQPLRTGPAEPLARAWLAPG